METIRSKGNLQNLIPIAVVVVGGCEPCAEKMVARHWHKEVHGRMSMKPCASLPTCRNGSAWSRRLDPIRSPGWKNRWQQGAAR